nr:HLA class II histocompatibility antigen, DRB1-7 beta chain-like isoform X3 [Columba livia]
MLPPHLLLFLFLHLLLPGMWADPEAEPQVFQLLHTGLFANVSSAEVSGVALLEDVPLCALDPANWSLHFHWPWARQAAAEGDMEKLLPHYKHFLRSMVRYVQEIAQQAKLDCPSTAASPSRGSWSTSCPSPAQAKSSYCTELPVATVFARTPSPAQLLLVCRVTGFYPRSISVAWLRDGQEVPPGPDTNTSAILPNADLTYQLRSVLAVAPHDGHSYACRVRHRSLGTRSLLIPWENRSTAPTISIAIAVLLLVAAFSAGGFWWWKRRKGDQGHTGEQEFII